MKILSDQGAPGNAAPSNPSRNGSGNGHAHDSVNSHGIGRHGTGSGHSSSGNNNGTRERVTGSVPLSADDERARVAVERATDEFDRGRAVVIQTGGVEVLAAPAGVWDRGAMAHRVEQIESARSAELTLALSARRAKALQMNWPSQEGASGDGAGKAEQAVDEDSIVQVRIPVLGAAKIARVASGATLGADDDKADPSTLALLKAATIEPAGPVAVAAVALAKQARLLPCAIVGWPQGVDALCYTPCAVRAEDVLRYDTLHARSLKEVARARVPLSESEQCLFVLFGVGSAHAKHLAIIVGEPDVDQPVALRLHSACLTGDVFASLRCDCGSQLRQAVDVMARQGGGVLLYLPQEGRGIGLANKLRAYRIQDTGFDTVDADALLGFSPDERDYGAAVSMLAQLGVTKVRLLTNNPHKMQALVDGGVEVVERMPLIAAVNRHNRPYLEAKAERSGHMLPLLDE